METREGKQEVGSNVRSREEIWEGHAAGFGFRRLRDSWVSLSVWIPAGALSVGLVHCPLLENPSSGERQMSVSAFLGRLAGKW